MAALPEEATEEAKKQSFWMPGHYGPTVRRPDRAHQACGDLKACLLERAAVERSYAAGLSQWSGRWSKVVETRPLYGSLLRAWRAFFSSAERLAAQHLAVSRALAEEEAGRLDAWRSSAFPRKLLCGFTETRSNAGSFARAQKPWASRLQKVEKARGAFHKACQKESAALQKEKQASDGSVTTQEKLQKITVAREKASEEKEKARERYEKLLEDVTSYTPRYMEEMEAIFDQSQEEEGKRIAFLKESFLSIHKHLDITDNENVKEVYSELHHTLMSINEQDDLRWWRNNQGPGMPTDWPRLQEWIPPVKKLKRRKQDRNIKDKRPVMIGGVQVRALYDYVGEEGDELSFKAGESFLKVEDEDEQGWCRGVLTGGREGFYPANYVEIAD